MKLRLDEIVLVEVVACGSLTSIDVLIKIQPNSNEPKLFAQRMDDPRYRTKQCGLVLYRTKTCG